MRELLQQAGFRLHGRRADCVHCNGRSRLTVSFTDDVAFCHRCKWTANAIQLARALGKTLEPESAGHLSAREAVRQFEKWRSDRYRKLAAEYRELGLKAELAKRILGIYPDCKMAWDALACFYHNEARLAGALDTLAGEKASPWDTVLLTVVFDAWELAIAS